MNSATDDLALPSPAGADADHARAWRIAVAHFRGTVSPDDEVVLRAHLATCARCRRRYDRRLLGARFDPGALAAKERLARGLGLRPSPPASWHRRLTSRWRWRSLAIACGAVAIAVLAVGIGRGDRRPAFDVRGGPAAGPPALWIYRMGAAGAPELVERQIARSDELAFAYGNPAGKAHLLLFAIDEHGHVYWYYPAWPRGMQAPAAIPARAGAGPFELPEAVRHALDGRRLEVYAVFGERAIGSEAIERAAARPGELALPPELTVVHRSLEVAP